jgi:hypothetical protein
MKYRLLIITAHVFNGCSVHTVLLELDTRDEAEAVASTLPNDHTRCVKLYK